jgi:hypothetical protein
VRNWKRNIMEVFNRYHVPFIDERIIAKSNENIRKYFFLSARFWRRVVKVLLTVTVAR